MRWMSTSAAAKFRRAAARRSLAVVQGELGILRGQVDDGSPAEARLSVRIGDEARA
jgi:hypothetical protein